MTPIERSALEFLSELERRESRLLSWGIVDTGFTEDELRQMATAHVTSGGAVGLTTNTLLDLLRERRLAFWFDTPEGTTVRTRMAETVRLAARLRQLFPKHMRGNGWRLAPTLVADYRLLLRPRTYPKREFTVQQVFERLGDLTRSGGMRRTALAALLGDGSRSLELARFQVDSIATVLGALDKARSSGIIICAGTGSGKTLAFYLPALSHIAALIDASHYTKALAIYPRNELLKDQFTETYREARRVEDVLTRARRRKLIIGAYFGPTPRNARQLETKNWRRVGGGWVCPYLRCPRCDADMIWHQSDIDTNRERLQCMRTGCSSITSDDEVMLTRERMERTPPDVLFTTTEMLNRNLGNSETGHVFGLGLRSVRTPDLVLLDEVHTYSGTAGAQAALLLRRWRHAVGRPVRFIGLSATLRDATRFFSRLVGVPEGDVTLLEPSVTDMTREGMEYMLALRGDPASGASMLATTIQVSMLMRRMLDDDQQLVSRGVYGTKLFAFTDNLDTVNRLYFDLLDAEGLDSFGHPLANRAHGSLATLRARDATDLAGRAEAGQLWEACEEIGHTLTPDTRLVIERTSSQDVGVDPRADVVVATSTLEVGFNDSRVGAVLQHKAPLDAAQFLQRKGRAGRKREMRPWTVVVLSDYGRDRIVYQGYEALFDPSLEPRHLPIGNRHVLRIQAVQALADWVAVRAAQVAPGSTWDDLSGPVDRIQGFRGQRARTRQNAIADLLEAVLANEEQRQQLGTWLRQSLQLSQDDAQALLWEPPRALLTSVIPTALRRLRSGWMRDDADGECVLDSYRRHPLPEFMPSNLFSDLDLPDVVVVTPPQKKGEEPERHPMAIAQALSEFAPGRVSRRFAVVHRYVRHWVAIDTQDPAQRVDVLGFCTEFERMGMVQVMDGDATRSIPLLRPTRIDVGLPPANVADSANGRLDWRSQLWPIDEGAPLPLPTGTPWAGFLAELRFFTHNSRSGVEVRRFAATSTATITFQSGTPNDATVEFMEGVGEHATPVAFGFGFRADGLVLRFRWPRDLDVNPACNNQDKIRGARAEYFRHLVLTSPALDGVANRFQRTWLAQVYLSALVMVAIQERVSLEQASARLQATLPAAMASVLDAIFQTLPSSDQDSNGQLSTVVQRVHRLLLDMIADPAVVRTLRTAGETLWRAPDEGWHRYARERFRTTLAATLLHACESLCPEFGTRDLVVDVHPGPRPPGIPVPDELEEVWLTEDGPGGGGIVEEIARRAVEDPRRFLRLMEAALMPTDSVTVDLELRRILEWAESEQNVRAALEAFRSAQGNDAAWQSFEALRDELNRKGAIASHAVMAATSARILRPGSSTETDSVLRGLVERWSKEEARLGVEVDARVFAYACAKDDSLDVALEEIAARAPGDLRQWRFGTVFSLLWPRGTAVRAQGLSFRSPYGDTPLPDPDLVGDQLRALIPRVSLDSASRAEEISDHFRVSGHVELVGTTNQRPQLRSEALSLVATPVDVGGLLLYPRIVGVKTRPTETAVALELREVLE